MDRVLTLLKKLQKQLDENSSVESMLQTVQILQAELINMVEKKENNANHKIAILMPQVYPISKKVFAIEDIKPPEEKIIEVLQVDEKEIEAELEQIKRNADNANSRSSYNRSPLVYDPIEEIPTLSHQDRIIKRTSSNEVSFENQESLNDRLKESKVELSQSLTSAPIKDLKKAIGVNDRFLFINELFRGDEAMYERSIKTIQNFSIYAEAEFWIRRELKVKIGWLEKDHVVKQFDQLVKRRFSA
jgi:hypothetical protein